jgi:hypothetical protein
MLYREVITVLSQIHTKHINTLCGQNVELLNVKFGSTLISHFVLNRRVLSRFPMYSVPFNPIWLQYTPEDLKLQSVLQYLTSFPSVF